MKCSKKLSQARICRVQYLQGDREQDQKVRKVSRRMQIEESAVCVCLIPKYTHTREIKELLPLLGRREVKVRTKSGEGSATVG